jgi:hypothetical protein
MDAGTEQPILEQVRTKGMLDHTDVISSNGARSGDATRERWEPASVRVRKDRNEMYSAVAAGSPLWSPRSTR